MRPSVSVSNSLDLPLHVIEERLIMKCILNMDNSFVLSRFSRRLRLLLVLTCRLQSPFLLGREKDKINVTETSFFYLTDNNMLHFPFDKSCKFLFSTRLKAFICSNSIGSCCACFHYFAKSCEYISILDKRLWTRIQAFGIVLFCLPFPILRNQYIFLLVKSRRKYQLGFSRRSWVSIT